MTSTETFDLSDLEAAPETLSSKQQKLAEAKAAIAGTTPLMQDLPDCIVHLPRGIFREGQWKQEAEVRELTGADEEALARTKEQFDFFDAILACGVVRIDSMDLAGLPVSDRQVVLRELLVGERAQLLLAILVATYGDEKLLNVICPHCDLEQEVTLLLSTDFKPKEVDGLHAFTYTYVTKKKQNIEYRLVTGADQNEALRRKGVTTAEQNTLILSRCIVKVNGEIVPDPMAFARNLGMQDRVKLLQAMVEKQPDIDLSVSTGCLGCGGDVVLSLGWGDLFRP